ncbi:MAG: S-adenosylmethionine:tRNA ribosyltransferase-isomerase, partial [Candidatus Binatia bacterium]
MNPSFSRSEIGSFWTGELEYHLPPGRIAQVPAARREQSRLMVVDREADAVVHATFADIVRFLPPRALLVANDSRVIPARLRGRKRGSGGVVEALVLGIGDGTLATAMVRVAKPLHEDQVVEFGDGVTGRVASPPEHGRVTFDFAPLDVATVLSRCGEIPLPPYIERSSGPTVDDADRYQTVYARRPGSVAAPTAGLHFTDALLAELRSAGVEFATVTLHVGPGTFTPVRGDVCSHEMEEEHYDIGAPAAASIADRAICRRAARSLPGVSPRKTGTFPNGSMMTSRVTNAW